ncbi:MAG: hypothetical protein QHD01_26285 [Bradyrhizobium sp.]|uniref:hypothetical protein n=1 Tax=Bradyrhizobium sp. TaxID=376 RepID=UPI0029B7DCE7|nr:hypothetical protein [Bradyrhizobium sp.]MDX3970088.1 hypothetical protein [Bradyrhizobium sp.]
MPTLDISGRKVKVGDDFLKLSPDEQNSTVEEIARSLGVTSEQQAPQPPAAAPVEAAPVVASPPAPAAGGGYYDRIGGYIRSFRDAVHAPTRALENGFLFGLGDRARAGMDAVIGAGGYGDNLAREQAETARFQAAHPIAAPAVEAVGNITTPLGVIGAASRGVGLGAKSLYAAGAGTLLGGAQGAASSKDWTNIPQTATDAGIGAATGFVTGGLLPGTARVVGAGYSRVADALTGQAAGMSRGASRHLVPAMAADTPAAVQARLAELGPDAMLVDAGPSFLGKGQGASLNSDEGRTIMQGRLGVRDQATNQRIMGDVNRALGPAEDPQTVRNAIVAHRSEVDARNYPAAFRDAPPVDTGNVLVELGPMIQGSPTGSMERRALENLRNMLMTERPVPRLDPNTGVHMSDAQGNRLYDMIPEPQSDPQLLHKIKGEIDNVVEYDAPGLGIPAAALSRQQGALKHIRGILNESLEQQVPGYLAANRQSAGLARRAEAVELGTQYLGSGKTTASPDRFVDEFGRLTPGEQIAFAKGSRGEIERKLGTKANDLQALRSELQGEGGWNTAKLAAVHGEPSAQELINSVNRNLKFRDTHNKVVENSQTAQRLAAKEAMNPSPSSETPLINPNATLSGMSVTAIKKALGMAYGAVKPSETRAFGEIADILSTQGPARDARVQAIIDALEKRRSNAAIAPAAGDRAALIAAIAAHGYARTNQKRRQER